MFLFCLLLLLPLSLTAPVAAIVACCRSVFVANSGSVGVADVVGVGGGNGILAVDVVVGVVVVVAATVAAVVVGDGVGGCRCCCW